MIIRKEMFTIRLWHYKLLPVLPDKMLVAEWRECIAIKRQWEKGTLKHRLVSYVMDYDRLIFLSYTILITNEMEMRNIKYQKKYKDEIAKFCFTPTKKVPIKDEYIHHYREHNDRYLKQCYYNLEEKHDRGIISDEEWKPINDLYWELDDKGYY